ncbi:DNA cytosine methyltransferase [Shewanella sp. 10N.7]|uniref:DNA cytosine methyltransferase n=1 Tax=Shewanella sp. 10N.7 TaxID=2885093 RepID=UPI001E38AC69|nr:DNA cytosine methyltransferase [Shewanella sp. 10N.7]MCC4834968.1 DNA cytosine methyltransferase [Shewanella sp. 10N.7]
MKSIDLFSGAGGLSCGLGMAGFTPILANELIAAHANTYQINNENTSVIVGDVRQVCETNLKSKLGLKKGELDLLAGGPPCQGFSVNAPIRDLDDERNHLFKDFLRVANELLPKAILIENVPGIVSLGKGTVVKQIYKELESLGYSVQHKILFAGHYGVPQTRFRTIIIAVKGNIGISFPEPEYDSKAVANFAGARELCIHLSPLFSQDLLPQTTVSDAISDLPEIQSGSKNPPMKYLNEAKGSYQSFLRNGSNLIHNHSCNGLGKINLDRLKHIPQGGNWTNIPHEMLPKGMQRARRSDHTKRYGRLHPEGMCSTILTKCDPHWGAFIHPEQDRVLSVREAARIQSFPDSYHFTGTIPQQYEQVGNAVPPFLAKKIGEEIIKIIG